MSHPYSYPPSLPPDPPRRGIPKWVWILVGVGGGAMLLGCVACGGVIAWFVHVPQASAAAGQPFELNSIPVPTFPDRGPPVEMEPGVVRYEISLGPQGGFYPTPGHGGMLWLYLPAGQPAPKSLPCILIAGAGSNLISGMSLGERDEPEQIPYVKAGCAVVAFELDGPESDVDGDETIAVKKSYEAFRASRAGLINARNALEYVLARVPEVDPARIYSAGHSSAGTLSLLFAEHESRLAGCIAYAPCTDVADHLTPVMVRTMSIILPGLVDFAHQSSPKTHEAQLKCPVFLFHAEDDSVCDIDDSRACEARLRQQGTTVSLETVSSGDHYDSMIEQGIPWAIQWLKRDRAK